MRPRNFLSCLAIVLLTGGTRCCNLEMFFSAKQVSIEENTAAAHVVFRGVNRPSYEFNAGNPKDFVVIFDFMSSYKGADILDAIINQDNFRIYRTVNVTFANHHLQPRDECQIYGETPTEYIIFTEVIDNEMRAVSVARWDELADQRVWMSLGWSDWSEWTPCSESCSMGIQQRTRYCLHDDCLGHNVEQRHCNMFGCGGLVNPLALDDSNYFHPSKERWERVPGRPTAWRLNPNSYIWVPSSTIYPDKTFPDQFVLFITMRIQNSSIGTIFSLRSRRQEDSYLSLELAGSDLKLIHAGANGTDAVRIPTPLDDGKFHSIAISVSDNTIVESYVDCEWATTDILKRDALDIPDDSDLIIGYLFSGDLEQLSISSRPQLSNLQCDMSRVPIYDPTVKDVREKGTKENEIDLNN